MPDATQNLKLKITADTSQATGMAGLKGFATAIAGLSAALYTAKQAYKSFIEPVIQYNKEIKDASESTGMATEELSRFVQVGDDMGVTMGSITKALEMGTKNGFAPSIDALAELADKGNAMASTTERAAMYTKIFGRNWAELNPILQLGGQRIREMAAAQADGLVVTEEEIRKTEELRVGLDELNDNWIGIRNNLVLGVTPALIQVTEKQNFWQAAAGLAARKTAELETEQSGYAKFLRDDLIPAINSVPDALEEIPLALQLVAIAEAIAAGDMTLANSLYARYREAKRLADQLRQIQDLLEQGFSPLQAQQEERKGGKPAGKGEGLTAGGQALGGEVGTGGNAYMVGEHGAERFTPKVPGTISPSRDQLATSIDRMVKALPTILIDAIERAK